MPRWLRKRLMPGETPRARFRAGWSRVLSLFGFLIVLMLVLFGVLATMMGQSILDVAWLLQGGLLLLGALSTSRFSQTVVTERRVLHRMWHLFFVSTGEIAHDEIEALELSPAIGGDVITLRGRSGQALVVNTVDRPAAFLDALLKAYPFKQLKVTGAPTAPGVSQIAGLVLCLEIFGAFAVAILTGWLLWHWQSGMEAIVFGPEIAWVLLLIPMGIAGFLAGATLVHIVLMVGLSRRLPPDALRQILLVGSAGLQGQGWMARYAQWSLRLNQRFPSWLYRRPVDLAPPSSTVSSD